MPDIFSFPEGTVIIPLRGMAVGVRYVTPKDWADLAATCDGCKDEVFIHTSMPSPDVRHLGLGPACEKCGSTVWQVWGYFSAVEEGSMVGGPTTSKVVYTPVARASQKSS